MIEFSYTLVRPMTASKILKEAMILISHHKLCLHFTNLSDLYLRHEFTLCVKFIGDNGSEKILNPIMICVYY